MCGEESWHNDIGGKKGVLFLTLALTGFVIAAQSSQLQAVPQVGTKGRKASQPPQKDKKVAADQIFPAVPLVSCNSL